MRKGLTDLDWGFLAIKVKTQLFKEDENIQIIQEQFLLLLRDPPPFTDVPQTRKMTEPQQYPQTQSTLPSYLS